MMRFVATITVLVLLTTLGTAWADRCIGPKDTTMFGITVPSASDIIFCDDFDTYCTTNFYAVPPVTWPGYPPNPDQTLCTSATDYMDQFLKTFPHWTKPYSGQPQLAVRNADAGQGGVKLEGWDGNGGWATLPYAMWMSRDTTNGCSYQVFDLDQGGAGPIDHWLDGTTTVNGTDNAPLVLRFWLNDNASLGSSNSDQSGYWPFYMELRHLSAGDDPADPTKRAPTDYILTGRVSQGYPVQCTEQGSSPDSHWPLICQQIEPVTGVARRSGKLFYCPPLTTTVYPSLAYGFLAPLDDNPCEYTNKPKMYHTATFDGVAWQYLDNNPPPAGNGRFTHSYAQAFLEMTIRTNQYDLKMIAAHKCTSEPHCSATCPPSGYEFCTSTKTLPRRYTGPFNRIAMGVGMGCRLDPTTGLCMDVNTPAGVGPEDYVRNHWNWDFNGPYLDRPVLYTENLIGACCRQEGSCDPDQSPATCSGTGDRFHLGQTCQDFQCCPLPFADADHDGDVDQDDFGAFQVCYTGTAGGVPTGCACFDRNTDGNINDADFQEFNNCWTGSNVQYSVALPPSCTP